MNGEKKIEKAQRDCEQLAESYNFPRFCEPAKAIMR